MKNIAIFTMGTRGDIQPYIFLAQALIKEGYKVRIGTHPCWQDLVGGAGVAFAPVGPDIDIEYEAACIRGKNKNPLMSMLRTMKFVFNIIENSTSDILAICKGNDLIIISHSQMGATEAEVLNIPTINVTLQVEMIPEVKKVQTFKDKIFSALINPQMVKPYNKIRRKYGLPALKSMDEVMSPILNMIPISRYVIEQNPYWQEQNKIVGYWYVNDDNYHPPKELEEFLSLGSKPIILALGAMSFESQQEREKLELFINAFKRTGKRAIIQGFNKTLEDYELPNTILKVGAIPHSWLFKQASCIIHHCGFGTSAATMIYGIPSIPIPHVLDQFALAEKLYKLNISVKPIKANALSVDGLTNAINYLDAEYDKLHKNALKLSRQIAEEKGLERAVKLINEVLD